jgi:hypothetical protein
MATIHVPVEMGKPNLALYSSKKFELRSKIHDRNEYFLRNIQVSMAAIRVILKVTLCLSPSLTIRSLFHPQFEYRWKVSETGYHHTKLGSSSQDWQDCIVTTRLEISSSSEGAGGKANPYLKVKLM